MSDDKKDAVDRFMAAFSRDTAKKLPSLPDASTMWMLMKMQAREEARRRTARKRLFAEIAVYAVIAVLVGMLPASGILIEWTAPAELPGASIVISTLVVGLILLTMLLARVAQPD